MSSGAVCSGNWEDPKYWFIVQNNGACRTIGSYNYETDANGWPLISECNKVPFFKYYTTAESLQIWEALYTNSAPFNLRDKFVAYWDVVAQKFAKNRWVMGFDPINEPFPSGFMDDYSILQPGGMDQK